MMKDIMNKKVIVRGDRSGVFFGTIVAKECGEVRLEKCRRIWRWDGAASISELAVSGTKNPDTCKFTVAVDSIILTDIIEIIPCTTTAIQSIEAVNVWTA